MHKHGVWRNSAFISIQIHLETWKATLQTCFHLRYPTLRNSLLRWQREVAKFTYSQWYLFMKEMMKLDHFLPRAVHIRNGSHFCDSAIKIYRSSVICLQKNGCWHKAVDRKTSANYGGTATGRASFYRDLISSFTSSVFNGIRQTRCNGPWSIIMVVRSGNYKAIWP